MAADLQARPPIYKAPPPPAPVWSWTGCYIGGHLGGGYAWTENTNTVNTTVFGDFAPARVTRTIRRASSVAGISDATIKSPGW